MDLLISGDNGLAFRTKYNANIVSLFGRITGASVKEYGAVGDGVSDDTVAIQNAIDDVQDGTLILPSGEYLVSTLEISRSLKLVGEGISLNGIGGSRLKSVSANPIIKIINVGDAISYCGCSLKNFAILGNNITDSTAKQTGVTIDKEGLTILDNIGIFNCGDYAIRIGEDHNVSGVYVEKCLLTGNSKGGVYSRCYAGDNGRQVNAIHILNSSISGNLGYGINLSGNSYVIINNIIQGNLNTGILISNKDLPLIEGGSKNVVIQSNYFEFNKGGEIIIEADYVGEIPHFHYNIDLLTNYYNTDLAAVTKEGISASITLLSDAAGYVKYLHIPDNNSFRLRNNAIAFDGVAALDETCSVDVN